MPMGRCGATTSSGTWSSLKETCSSFFTSKILDLLGDADCGADGAENGDDRLDDAGNGPHDCCDGLRDHSDGPRDFADEAPAFLLGTGSGGEGECVR